MTHRSRLIHAACRALASPDLEVRDAAICLLEKMRGPLAGQWLEMHALREPAPWLADYCKRVAAEIRGEESK